MFKLSYGLFVLTAKDGARDNGCIIKHPLMQITEYAQAHLHRGQQGQPHHDMIKKTGVFNLSVLSQEAPFKIFQHYGFQSGKNVDKFEGHADAMPRTENGLIYLPASCNAVLSGKVVATQEYETHTVFFADVTEAAVLSDAPSMTYDYYFSHVKPKPQPAAEKKVGWVCKICGYVYEGEVLPPDFICPLCKHGAEDFEPLS